MKYSRFGMKKGIRKCLFCGDFFKSKTAKHFCCDEHRLAQNEYRANAIAEHYRRTHISEV